MTTNWLGLKVGMCACAGALLGAAMPARAQPAAETKSSDVVLLTFSGKVEVAATGGNDWTAGKSNQVLHVGYVIRTGKSRRAALQLSNRSLLRVFELTTLQIQAPQASKAVSSVDLSSG